MTEDWSKLDFWSQSYKISLWMWDSLDQIKEVECLNLFIASLQDYDVSSFKYIVPAFGESGLAKITE